MHLAYSALINLNGDRQQAASGQNESELITRYRAYEATCAKYKGQIEAIQKYLPGWQPKFR